MHASPYLTTIVNHLAMLGLMLGIIIARYSTVYSDSDLGYDGGNDACVYSQNQGRLTQNRTKISGLSDLSHNDAGICQGFAKALITVLALMDQNPFIYLLTAQI